MTNKELILANLMRAMIKYDGSDAPRIQHFVKVHDFARMIAIAEGMNQEDLFVLEAAAILHDVGIHVSEARYGNCDGKHQEELGPDEARKVLSEVDGFTDRTDRKNLLAHCPSSYLSRCYQPRPPHSARSRFPGEFLRSPPCSRRHHHLPRPCIPLGISYQYAE
mgnify:FL=1